MLRAALFLLLLSSGILLALFRGPIWGLISYMFIYFIPSQSAAAWWMSQIPFTRFSLLTAGVTVVSMFLHRHRLVSRPFRSAWWGFLFIVLAVGINLSSPARSQELVDYSYKLVTYGIAMVFILKIVKTEEQFRLVLLTILVMTGHLALLGYLEGERVHARLEFMGSNDASGSNEFGLLLGSVFPLVALFVLRGNRYERILAFLLAPFIVNAFILCNSRGAFLAVATSALFVGIFSADGRMRKYMAVSAAFAVPLFLILTDPEFVDRLSSLLATKEAVREEERMDELTSGRTEIWRYGTMMVRDHPTGAGSNRFRHLAHLYMPDSILKHEPGAPYGVRAAHNSFLQVLVEQGYLGLLIWLVLCGHTMILLRNASKTLSRSRKSTSFLGFSVLALNLSFACTVAGGMAGSRVYYEFFWWQVALSIIAGAIASEAAGKTWEPTSGKPA